MLKLDRPDGLEDSHWGAISASATRLERAESHPDRSQALGAAKDLVEAVAKVTLEVRGETLSQSDKFGTTLNRAHSVLDRQPGQGLSNDPAMQRLIQSLKGLAGAVNDLRNNLGTGHGWPREPEIADEVVPVAVLGATIWVQWALKRLGHVAAGLPLPLIEKLHGVRVGVFYAGDLTRQLVAAHLSNLDVPTQRSIGSAVARRAMGGTFNVHIEGIDACTATDSLVDWPTGYRAGLVVGLFLDDQARPWIKPWGAVAAASALVPLGDDAATIAQEILDLLPFDGRVASYPEVRDRSATAEMRLVSDRLTGETIYTWLKLADQLDRLGEPTP